MGDSDSPVYAIFFLISPEDSPGQHLQMLADLARRVDEEQFMEEWQAADDEHDLKESLLHHERYVSLYLSRDSRCETMIGKQILDLDLPAGTLIALVQRDGQIVVPHGRVRLEAGDRVTIIGDSEAIDQVYRQYHGDWR